MTCSPLHCILSDGQTTQAVQQLKVNKHEERIMTNSLKFLRLNVVKAAIITRQLCTTSFDNCLSTDDDDDDDDDCSAMIKRLCHVANIHLNVC